MGFCYPRHIAHQASPARGPERRDQPWDPAFSKSPSCYLHSRNFFNYISTKMSNPKWFQIPHLPFVRWFGMRAYYRVWLSPRHRGAQQTERVSDLDRFMEIISYLFITLFFIKRLPQFGLTSSLRLGPMWVLTKYIIRLKFLLPRVSRPIKRYF